MTAEVWGRGNHCLRLRMYKQRNPNYLSEKQTRSIHQQRTGQMWSVFSGKMCSWKLYRTLGNGNNKMSKKIQAHRLQIRFCKTL